MDENDFREVRTDVKTILSRMATIEARLQEAIPPCLYFQQHVREHEKSRSAFGWVLSSIIAPILTTVISVWALLKFGMKP